MSFDPILTFFNQFFFYVLFFFFFLNLDFFWFNMTLKIYLLSFIDTIKSEIFIASKFKSNINLKLVISLFLVLLVFNLIGLFPFSFTITSQLNSCFFFSLTFWILSVIMPFVFYNNNFFSHLVPLGSPMLLSHFMVLIETLSLFIRPLTLGVRLMANLTAGHLILILCSSPMVVFNLVTFPVILVLILEVAVALIQSYVFVILVSMYIGEFN